jgi:hypothetical protein
MALIFGAILVAAFTFGDDVVLERDRILVALHDDQFSPAPGQMHAERELVAPTADAVGDPLPVEVSNQLLDGGENGVVEEIGVVGVVLLLPPHCFALGGELVRLNIAIGLDAAHEPLQECFIHVIADHLIAPGAIVK